MKKRIHCIFKGKVQGVGFRFTTQSLAYKYNVVGWVRNNPDGSVELVAEQEEEILEKFIEDIKSYFTGYIEEFFCRDIISSEELHGFKIRYY